MIDTLTQYILSIKRRIRHLTTSPLMRMIVVTPPAVCLIMSCIILWQLPGLPPQVPLYYSRPWGSEQLAHPLFLFLLPASTMFWYVISILLIHIQTYQYRVFAQLLLTAQTVMSLGMLYILIRIILLVT